MTQPTQADLINYIANQTYMYGHILIIITGLIGNNIGIFIFSTKLKDCVGSLYLIAFYISNNIALFIYILPNLILTIYGTNGTEYSLPWCVFMYYFVHVLMVFPPLVLSLASIDRYFCSSRQVHLRQCSSMKIAKISIITIIIASLCFASPNFVYRHINTDWNDCTAGDPYWYYVSYFLIPVIITGIPLIILSVFGYLTYQNLRKSIHTVQPTISYAQSTLTSNMTQPHTRQYRRLDNQVARMLLAQIICFSLQTVLFTIVYFYVTFTYDWEKEDMSAAIENLVSTLLYLIYDTSLCFSFYLYYFLSKPFRTTVNSIFTRSN